MPKKKQLSLDGKIVSPVSVNKEPVNYVKVSFVTSKFKMTAKDCDIDESEDLGDLVRQKIRAVKGAMIEKGDYEEAVVDILKKIETEEG